MKIQQQYGGLSQLGERGGCWPRIARTAKAGPSGPRKNAEKKMTDLNTAEIQRGRKMTAQVRYVAFSR